MKTRYDSKAARTTRFYSAMERLGFSFNEADTLRRAEMTLHRWAERECGDGSNYYLERDETTGRCYNVSERTGKRYRTPDRERGALRRIAEVIEARNARNWRSAHAQYPVSFYHQTDPRGCALYILRPGDVPEGEDVSAYYSRGIAVCI